MKSRRQVVATLISSILSQVIVILLLLLILLLCPLSTDHSSSSSSSSSLFPFAVSYLPLHLLLLFLLPNPTSEVAASISYISDSVPPTSPSPSSPSPSRKRKREYLTSQMLQQQQEKEQEQEQISVSSSSSSSSSIRDSANCNALPSSPLLLISDPNSFRECFHMSSGTFEWLSGLLEPLLECRDPIGFTLNLSPHARLGIGLFRFATGLPYPDIARRFGVSESTSRFCTKQLCRVLCTNFRFWVAFPSSSELQSVSAAFEALGGLPNCCGIIECIRFDVNVPLHLEDEDNNEDDHLPLPHRRSSIAAQLVVDSSSRILNIVTGFHGHKGDSLVLKSTALGKDVQGGRLLNSPPVNLQGISVPQYLIGHAGYPLLPWLMVPFDASDPLPAPSQEDFNAIHRLMRAPALGTLASLKTWGILSRPIQEESNMAVACIAACSILHNVLLMREDFSAHSVDGVSINDYSLHVQSSEDPGLEERLVFENASGVRNALAARATELRTDFGETNINMIIDNR